MNIKDILSFSYAALSRLSKNKLLWAIQSLREKYIELEEKNKELKAENEKLQERFKDQKIKSVNTIPSPSTNINTADFRYPVTHLLN